MAHLPRSLIIEYSYPVQTCGVRVQNAGMSYGSECNTGRMDACA